jgi:ribonucleoside-triphosphate reductase
MKRKYKILRRCGMDKCQAKMEVYSRVVGFYRPVKNWNRGKQEEFRERLTYKTA